jgi:hypothetical protein
MDDEARRTSIGKIVEALNARDLDAFDALYHDDVVIQWPQSGEVIRGKKSIRELREAYPTPPTATLRRVVGCGDLWAMELDFDYDGDPFNVVIIHQYRDGLVISETGYYATPFEAPAWRAKWVEPRQVSVR